MLEDRRMMPSFSSLENLALAAASLAGSRRRNRPVAGGPAVRMWCTVLCLTGGRPPAALATDWNSLKMPLKAGGVASMAGEKAPARRRRVGRRRWPGCEPLERNRIYNLVCRQINN